MRRSLVLLPLALVLFACSADSSEEAGKEDDFSSNQATLLDFEFDGELTTDSSWDDKKTIEGQLLYTIGHLNHDKSVGRLDNLELTNVKKTEADKVTTIKYHAKLPVAWGSKTNLPTSYEFKLPRDVSSQGLEKFTEAYKHSCVDWGAHEVDSGSMWYYYRPNKQGCDVKDAELVKTTATVVKSAQNTTGKFPEYHEVWKDDRLEVVAIFGKYENTGGAGDAGVSGFNNFVRLMKGEMSKMNGLTSTPANVADAPGPDTKDVTFEASLADGKKVKVTALLVDAITSTWPGFDARYEALTPTADVIAYNGHAGLGQNVRALARKGKWLPNKYQVFFMNGCDTFAYVDGSLAQTRAALNPSDPTGTKYMEFVTNAMPSFFSSMPNATVAVIKGLLSYEQPKTYDQIFENIDRSEVVLVTGEEDNAFTPGMKIGGGGDNPPPPPPPPAFAAKEETGTVAKNEEKAFAYDVPAGTFFIDLSGTADADLYVKKEGLATSRAYDCRPYKAGSAETCSVTFTQPGKLNVMVRGWAASSSFTLRTATK